MESIEWPEAISEFSRSRLVREGAIEVGENSYTAEEIVSFLGPLLTDERRAKLEEVVAKRTFDFVPVFENPYDLGNVSAVMRSCEAFGFLEFDLVIPPGSRFKAANRVARGADKWLDVQVFRSATDCARNLRHRGFQILATHLNANASPLESVDFKKPTAIILGNEKDGVSREMLEQADGAVMIPMQGFTQSFNISVAAALVFYQAWLSRGGPRGSSLNEKQRLQVLANYYLRCFDNPARLLQRQAPPKT